MYVRLTALSLLCSLALAAQSPQVVSPEVAADGQVTFRLYMPRAEKVAVSGEFTLKPVDMTKSEQGIWSVRVGPLKPQLYGYNFIVDGVSLIDPSNSNLKTGVIWQSNLLEVGAPGFWSDKAVPHGTIHMHSYASPSAGDERRVYIYTPPGYETSKKTYPTLYLFHGYGDDESGWSRIGKANYILDNLIAEGRAEPMLIVMPFGHPIDPRKMDSTTRSDWMKNDELFEKDVVTTVMPLVEKNYRVQKSREGRAVTGLSMGGGHSLRVGLNHQDLFAWVGAFSAATPGDPKTFLDTAIPDAQKFNVNNRLFWIALGQDDFLLDGNKAFDAALTSRGIKHEYHVTEGAHTWVVWKQYLRDYAQLLFKK